MNNVALVELRDGVNNYWQIVRPNITNVALLSYVMERMELLLSSATLILIRSTTLFLSFDNFVFIIIRSNE